MDANRFDAVSKFFARRRLSRREAVIEGGTAFAAAGLVVAGLARSVSAQDDTPNPEESTGSDGVSMLFVQTYQSGAIAPKDGSDGRFTLSLQAGVGQTIYFSDRPDRIVGATPTDTFLTGLGFPDDDPPNAALVVQSAPDDTDIAVVELFSPVYDAATGDITYEIEVLGNWQAELDMDFTENPTDLSVLAPSFGTAHLFIDGILDCPDSDLTCYIPDASKQGGVDIKGTIPNADHDGFCVSRPQLICYPCKNPQDGGGWADECNRRFPACNGQCHYTPGCTGVFGC